MSVGVGVSPSLMRLMLKDQSKKEKQANPNVRLSQRKLPHVTKFCLGGGKKKGEGESKCYLCSLSPPLSLSLIQSPR